MIHITHICLWRQKYSGYPYLGWVTSRNWDDCGGNESYKSVLLKLYGSGANERLW